MVGGREYEKKGMAFKNPHPADLSHQSFRKNRLKRKNSYQGEQQKHRKKISPRVEREVSHVLSKKVPGKTGKKGVRIGAPAEVAGLHGFKEEPHLNNSAKGHEM